jgi:glycosyltransferase involved in cell wall biosynthesis
MRGAQRVVLVTERMADAFRAQYPDLPRDHFTVVSNGFDPSQLQPLAYPPRERASFEVVHAGALYYGRSLTSFLAAAARLAREDAAFASTFQLTLLGTLDAAARAEVASAGLTGRVEVTGQVDHATALATMRRAGLLLLIANTTPGAAATVPAKLYEYLALGRPILAVAPPESSTADVLELTRAGWLARADDVENVACALRQAFAAHQTDGALSPDASALARFDRRMLAGDLARILDDLRAARRV